MRWVLQMTWRESRYVLGRGLLLLCCMTFGLTVLVSYTSIRRGFQSNFYEIGTALTGGDLRVEITGRPSERLKRLLPRLGDTREAFWYAPVSIGESGAGHLWLRQINPSYSDSEGHIALEALPPTVPVTLFVTESMLSELGQGKPAEGFLGAKDLRLDLNWRLMEEEALPVWTQQIRGQSVDRITAQSAWVDLLLQREQVEWFQVWVYHLEGRDIAQRIARARYLLSYIEEESHGVRLIAELPDQTVFFHTFRVIANTLFLAAFSALLLGTLAYTVTFVDLSKSRANQVALLRCLGCSQVKAWAVYATQIVLYALISVLLAGTIAVTIQKILPSMLSDWTGTPMDLVVEWRSLVLTLFFGACVILLPGLIAILPMLGCEPVEVLRSVKMPARRNEHRWAQAILAALTLILAIGFALQMVDDRSFALGFMLGMLVVYGLMQLAVRGLRRLVRQSVPGIPRYPLRHAASSLYRAQNQYGFTLSSIAFGLFLITFLFLFFRGFHARGVGAITGFGYREDARILHYLEWLRDVLFLNQWIGVLLLIIGVLGVLVLLTSQRRSRIHESVILGTLGATDQQIREIVLWESLIASVIASFSGVIGGMVVGSLSFRLIFNIPVTLPTVMLLGLVAGTAVVMVGMAFLNMKGVIGYPPLEVLRRRRHFDNW